MDDEEFEAFEEWILEKAGENDAYWLDTWISDKFEEWEELEVCECGARGSIQKDIWSGTRNHILERQKQCRKCKKIKSVQNYRNELRGQIKKGNIRVKDLSILKKEVHYREKKR